MNKNQKQRKNKKGVVKLEKNIIENIYQSKYEELDEKIIKKIIHNKFEIIWRQLNKLM